MDAEFMWEQYEIAITTVNRTNPAAGMPFSSSDFEACNTKRATLNAAGTNMSKSELKKYQNVFAAKYDKLVASNVLTGSNPVVNPLRAPNRRGTWVPNKTNHN